MIQTTELRVGRVIPIRHQAPDLWPSFRREAKTKRVIGLTGRMGAGKDASAALLSMLGYHRIAFADQVRHEVTDAIRRKQFPVEAVNSLIWPHLIDATTDEVWEKPTSDRMRRILQWWGTEYRRKQDPDYWIKAAVQHVGALGCYVFTDVRFPNEVAAIRELHGHVWKIWRPVEPSGIPGHISERMVDEITPDLTIENTGTLLDLAKKLREALKR